MTINSLRLKNKQTNNGNSFDISAQNGEGLYSKLVYDPELAIKTSFFHFIHKNIYSVNEPQKLWMYDIQTIYIFSYHFQELVCAWINKKSLIRLKPTSRLEYGSEIT